MKIQSSAKFLLLVVLCLGSQVFGAPPKAAAPPAKKPAPVKTLSPVSVAGVYEGTVTMAKQPGSTEPAIQLPIVFALEFTDVDIPTNADEPYLVKKQIQGSFLLDGEAGPFPLTTADFEFGRAHFNLAYNKLSTTGTPSPAVSLRFECDRHPDGSCSGTVVSSQNNKFATFTMHKSSKNASVLTATPKYVGQWKGKIVIKDYPNDPNKPLSPLKQMNTINKALSLPELPQDNDFGIYLAASDGQDPANPSKLELDSTPKRLGSAWISNQAYNNFIFSTIIFDYFHRKAWFTYSNPLYPQSSLQQTFIANYDKDGNFTSGQWNTENYGETGNFTAEKLK